MSMKFFEVQKYIILTEHMVDSFAVVINGNKWKSIPENLQKVVIAGIRKGREKSDSVFIPVDDDNLRSPLYISQSRAYV